MSGIQGAPRCPYGCPNDSYDACDRNGSRLECDGECCPLHLTPDEGLMAAAPDLLAALVELVTDLEAAGIADLADEWPDLAVTYQHARAAIRRATGNAGCDRCGVEDRAPGLTTCAYCAEEGGSDAVS